MPVPAIQAARRKVVPLRFGPHDRVTLAGRPYCRPRPTSDGWLFSRDGALELSEELSHERIDDLVRQPGYRYERAFYDSAIVRHRAAKGARSMDDIARDEQPEVLFRYELCKRLDRLCREGRVTRSLKGYAAAIPIIKAEVAPLECAKVQSQPTIGKAAKGKTTAAAPAGARTGGRRRGIPTSGKGEISLRKMPPISTFKKWWKKYISSGRVPWGLRDEYGNCGGAPAPICETATAILDRMGQDYRSIEKPSKALLLERMRDRVAELNEDLPQAKQIRCPSRKQLDDYLDSLRHVAVVAGRDGLDAARRKKNVVTQGVGVVRPLQRVEMDHWEVHLQSILVAIGLWDRLSRAMRRQVARMQVCVAIDVATKVILGLHLSETATTADAVAVMRMVVSDKRPFADAVGAALPWDMCGTPETVATDGGSAFTSEVFGLLVASLGCDHVIPPAGLPFLRGTIERFFRTVHMRLIARFRGRTFEDILRLGDYPAEKLANLDTRDLAWVIVRWVVDVYHATPHAGLGNATPRDAWLDATHLFGTTPPPDPHVRRSIFGIPLIRTLTSEGLRILGLRYWSEELVEIFLAHGQCDVEIKLDPDDLGEISVRIGASWHAARCVRGDVTGIDVETWTEAASEMRRVRADCATLTVPVVREAIKAIEAVGTAAQDREGIANPEVTAEQVDHLERGILLGFRVPDPVADAQVAHGADPFAGGIPVTGPSHTSTTLPESATPPAGRPAEDLPNDPDNSIPPDDTQFED